MEVEQVDGVDAYVNALFPTVGRQGSAIWLVDGDALDQLHATETTIAGDVCRALWAEREVRRTTADEVARIFAITIDHPIVGTVKAGICVDCRWVVWDRDVWSDAHPWDYQQEHSDTCVQGRALTTDLGPDGAGRPMRITPSATDLQAGGWGPYYDKLTPRRLHRAGYGLVGRTNYGAGQARELWEQREALRAESATATPPTREHRGVVITHGWTTVVDAREVDVVGGFAACLDCMWIESVADSLRNPQWHAATLAVARQHQTEMGTP